MRTHGDEGATAGGHSSNKSAMRVAAATHSQKRYRLSTGCLLLVALAVTAASRPPQVQSLCGHTALLISTAVRNPAGRPKLGVADIHIRSKTLPDCA